MYSQGIFLLSAAVLVASQQSTGYQNERSSGSSIGVGNENFGTSNDNTGTSNDRYAFNPNADRNRNQGTRNEGTRNLYGSSGTANEASRYARPGSNVGVSNENSGYAASASTGTSNENSLYASASTGTSNNGNPNSHRHGYRPDSQFGAANQNLMVRPTGTTYGAGNTNYGTRNENDQSVQISTVTMWPQRDGYIQTITVSQPATTGAGIFSMQSTAYLPKFASDYSSSSGGRGSVGISNEMNEQQVCILVRR